MNKNENDAVGDEAQEAASGMAANNAPAMELYTVRLSIGDKETAVPAGSVTDALRLARSWVKTLGWKEPKDCVHYKVICGVDEWECATAVGDQTLPPSCKEYWVWMGECGETVIAAASDEEALAKAEKWVKDGDWSECEEEVLQRYQVISDEGDWDCKTAVGGKPEPECSEDEHDWQRPHELVRGMEENPGVWSRGAHFEFQDVCAHCGMHRTTLTEDTQNDIPERVTYSDADAESLAWAAANTKPIEIAGYEVEFRQVGFDTDGEVCSTGNFHRTFAAALADSQDTGHGSVTKLYIDRDFICVLDEFAGFADQEAAENRVREIFGEDTAPEVITGLKSLVGGLFK
jgi:hypothetical protein